MTKAEHIKYWENCSYPRIGRIVRGNYKGLNVQFSSYFVGTTLNSVLQHKENELRTFWRMSLFEPIDIPTKVN